MPFHDASGRITIDEIIANHDIVRLNSARESLENALGRVTNLMEHAAASKGESSIAITEKANELKKQLLELINRIDETKSCINNTVHHYQVLDAALKDAITAANIGNQG